MSFVVFLALFVVLCGWLDARIQGKPAMKELGRGEERE
jgi:hypothetical protein